MEALFGDDRLLLDAFAARGVDAQPVVWSDREVDWDTFDAAVLRSTWDYVDRLGEFLDVTATIAASRCTLLNPVRAVHWNADKRYLDDLDRIGVPIVPLRRGMPVDAARLLAEVDEAGWRDLVVKPAVGVGGAGVMRADASRLADALGTLAPRTEVMVQPFADAVLDEGELSFVFVGGRPSHVLRKRPAAGDFRAHGIYGGTVERVDPGVAAVAEVAAMAERLPFDLTYARFDVVRFAGRMAVLELELIEPMLYLDRAPGSAGRLADATIERTEPIEPTETTEPSR